MIGSRGIWQLMRFFWKGTTWLSAIVYMLVNDGKPQSLLTGAPLKFKVPYLEMTIPYGDELEQEMMALDHLKRQADPRTYVTHLSANAIPKQVMDDVKVRKAKFCCAIRTKKF